MDESNVKTADIGETEAAAYSHPFCGTKCLGNLLGTFEPEIRCRAIHTMQITAFSFGGHAFLPTTPPAFYSVHCPRWSLL
jgi:hypothetical protein